MASHEPQLLVIQLEICKIKNHSSQISLENTNSFHREKLSVLKVKDLKLSQQLALLIRCLKN